MKGNTILLALSGSQQSRMAAETCWKLSQTLGATITAHHVVDSHSAWHFMGHDNPGFIESSAYLQAYQQIVSTLFTLGEKLGKAYAEEAQSRGVDNVCIIDEGNPVKEICRLAVDHKLVVIGHQKANARSQGDHSEPLQRFSVAEALANDCPKPLLVIQDECKEWSSMSIMISLDHINESFINSSLDMANALGLKPALICLKGGVHEEDDVNFVINMRAANPRLKDIPITVAAGKKKIDVKNFRMYASNELDKDFWSNTLIVIPSRNAGMERLTVVDSSPSLFVRFLEPSSILLWPEECVFSFQRTVENSERNALAMK